MTNIQHVIDAMRRRTTDDGDIFHAYPVVAHRS